MSDKIKRAIDTLVEAWKEDPGYRYSWQANIAMAFKDSFSIDKSMHEISNIGADNFLKMLEYTRKHDSDNT